MTGRVVNSLDASERFLWDLRQTVSDMLVENYAGRFRELARQHGIRLSIEAYDGCPCDDIAYGGHCDEPMAEFWRWGYSTPYSCVEMSSAAHIYGRRILGAESFTSTDLEKWLSHPATIKTLGDWAFCEGINRFVFHRYAMQPWLDRKPGMSMGPWGLHYERTQTWWEQSRAWHQYLARCQYLLRQGLFVADICYLQPEGSPRRFNPPMPREGNEPDRPGYNFDGCTADAVFTRMSVGAPGTPGRGRIVLPDGMSYRLLVLPEAQTMTPRLLARIAELVEAGATVVGPRPVRSPSMTGYPQCDEEVKKIADRLWGDCDGKQVKEHRLGAGRIVWGQTPAEVLAGMKIMPDFAPTLGDSPVRFIHRHTEDGTELYFVANKTDKAQELSCFFRVQGKRPEFWWPESGRIEPATVCNMMCGKRTAVPLRLEPAESVFVVFRAPWESFDPIFTITHDGQRVLSGSPRIAERTVRLRSDNAHLRLEAWKNGQYALKTWSDKTLACTIADLPPAREITGPWDLSFPPKLGAPEKVVLEKLTSWSDHAHKGVKYFSGTATYRKTFDLPQDWLAKDRIVDLDLGKVEVMAEVKLNGHDLGILWKPPYRVAITGAAKPGPNELEVKVTNLWINRMIGDEQLPEDSDRNANGTLKSWPRWLEEGKPSPTGRITFTSWRLWKKDSPLQPSGLLGPVKVLAAEVKALTE